MSPILLSPEEQQHIESLLESADPQIRRRARIVLTYHYGAPTRVVAAEVGLSRPQTRHYRHLFEVERMAMFHASEQVTARLQPVQMQIEPEEEEQALLPAPLEEDGEEELPPVETDEEREARRAAKKELKRLKKQARRDAKISASLQDGRENTLSQPPPFSKDENGGGGRGFDASQAVLDAVVRATLPSFLEDEEDEWVSDDGAPHGAEKPEEEEQETLPSPPAHPPVGEGSTSFASPTWAGGGGDQGLRLPLPLPAPGLLPDDTLAEAGRKTLLYHFAEMLSHEEGTRLGEDIEALHDMRVATRRMRAALDLFGPAYQPKTVQKHLKGLRLAGRALGRVRDLDVFIEKAGNYVRTLPPELQPGLDPLLDNWRQQRELDRLALTEHLNSKAHTRFILGFNRFVQTPGMGTAAEIDVSTASALPAAAKVRHVAPSLIYTRLAAVRAFEAILPTATVPQLHLLRIEFKKLRYTLEFFQEVLGPEARSVINLIKKVQDHLGDLQDAEVACQRLRLFLDAWDSGQVSLSLAQRQSPAGIVTYLAERHTERHRLITTFPETWAVFNSPGLQRSLALAISIL